MELKFDLQSKREFPNGTVSLRFIPVEGGPTGELVLDNFPAAEAAAMAVPTSDERAGITHRDKDGTPVGPFAEKKAYQSYTITINAA